MILHNPLISVSEWCCVFSINILLNRRRKFPNNTICFPSSWEGLHANPDRSRPNLLVLAQMKHPELACDGVVSKYFFCGQTIKELGVAEGKNVEIGSLQRARPNTLKSRLPANVTCTRTDHRVDTSVVLHCVWLSAERSKETGAGSSPSVTHRTPMGTYPSKLVTLETCFGKSCCCFRLLMKFFGILYVVEGCNLVCVFIL